MPTALHNRYDTRSIELAGFAAAHAICCVFDRQPLAPLAFTRRGPDAVTLSVRGVFSHDTGGRMWEACVDESR